MKYYCNPINVPYAYSFKKEPRDNFKLTVNREAADPSMVMYGEKYYLFASMTGSVWVSEDMVSWKAYSLPGNLPIYDYAPDVRVIGEWLYFTASNRGVPCSFYRTKDPIHGPYEEIKGTMEYWDPNLFLDDDGRMYFYWGCDNRTPIWGVELDPQTMSPIGEKKDLIKGNPWSRGYERFGENHSENPRSEAEIDVCFAKFLEDCGERAKDIPKENYDMIRTTFANLPYIEGAWMTKHDRKYYLQYACPGAEINVYADGVYIGDSPLGPFVPAESNPFSYKPGGFLPGAGHGSTMKDKEGRWWHTATMRISKNHVFERRVGIWPCGFDEEGTLYCNQRYGDWPLKADDIKENPWKNPEWMLLSFRAKVSSSGCVSGHEENYAVDENVQTWWKADRCNEPWIQMDLGDIMDVHAIQLNFADDMENEIPCPGKMIQTPDAERYIDLNNHVTAWYLEGSLDGRNWFMLEDKRKTEGDMPHDFLVWEEGKKIRQLRLTVIKVPYEQNPSISGFRVFGTGNGERPKKPVVKIKRISELDMMIDVKGKENPLENVVGYQILWGNSPDKLYHSWMVMGECKNHRVGALVKGQQYYVRVDAFNTAGITEGDTVFLCDDISTLGEKS